MNKKGVGHVEIILSFVIFIGVVGFALYFLNPARSDNFIETSADYVFRSVAKNTSIEFEKYSVKVITPGDICIEIENINSEMGVRAEDIDGGEVGGASRSRDFVSVNTDKDFIFVEFSEEFTDSGVGCAAATTNYVLASSEKKEIVSEKRFKELSNKYSNDYIGLKDELNLPKRAEFGFALIFSDSDFIKSEKNLPDDSEVFSESRRIEVLREDGKIVFADFVVEIW